MPLLRIACLSALSVFIGVEPILAATPGNKPVLTTSERVAIVNVVRHVIATIREGNAQELLGYIRTTQGLECTDTAYSYAQVKKALMNPGSYFHQSLFDTVAFAHSCGSEYPDEYPAISDKQFLETSNDEIGVKLFSSNWAEVTIQSPVAGHYKRIWSLYKDAGHWKLAGAGFIIGNCTCG